LFSADNESSPPAAVKAARTAIENALSISEAAETSPVRETVIAAISTGWELGTRDSVAILRNPWV
jgi:hypothetical protein